MARPDPITAAQWLQRKYGIQLPVKPLQIAENLGIHVEYRPLSPGLSGCLIPERIGRKIRYYIIILNSRHPLERQMFTCAHELGHWVMHRKMRPNFVCGPWLRNAYEYEANTFAAELLMPTKFVRGLAPHMAFTSLAGLFGVSLTAMNMRLEELQVMCA